MYYYQVLLPSTIIKYYYQILLPSTIIKYYYRFSTKYQNKEIEKLWLDYCIYDEFLTSWKKN